MSRLITIDFTNDPPKLSVNNAGEIGEINAVKIKVIPEKEMTENTSITSYIVKFAIDGGNVSSTSFTPSQDIEISLWGQLTQKMILPLQLIAQNDDATITMKSKVVRLTLDESLQGTNLDVDTSRDSILAQIGGFATRVTAVENSLADKVDKVTGKGLSTNDYTTAEKTKLAGIEEGANNYTLPTASSSVMGGVKVDNDTIKITDGVISSDSHIEIAEFNSSEAAYYSKYSYSELVTLSASKVLTYRNHILFGWTFTSFSETATARYDDIRDSAEAVYTISIASNKKITTTSWVQLATSGALSNHTNDSTIHVTASDKTNWDAKLSDAPSDDKQYARKNGEWAEVEGGSGGGKTTTTITITGSITPDEEIDCTSSLTYAELKSAYDNGNVIVARCAPYEAEPYLVNNTAIMFGFSKQIDLGEISGLDAGYYNIVMGVWANGNSHIYFNTVLPTDAESVYFDDTSFSHQVTNVQDALDNLDNDISAKQNSSISISGISATTVEGALAELKDKKTSVTLDADSWTNKSQTVSATGVTADNTIIVSPSPSNYLAYGNSEIRATAQGSGTITFACETVPMEDLSVNLIILGV